MIYRGKQSGCMQYGWLLIFWKNNEENPSPGNIVPSCTHTHTRRERGGGGVSTPPKHIFNTNHIIKHMDMKQTWLTHRYMLSLTYYIRTHTRTRTCCCLASPSASVSEEVLKHQMLCCYDSSLWILPPPLWFWLLHYGICLISLACVMSCTQGGVKKCPSLLLIICLDSCDG